MFNGGVAATRGVGGENEKGHAHETAWSKERRRNEMGEDE